MPLESRRPTGPTTVKSSTVEISTEHMGEKRSLTTSGIFLSKKMSSLATMKPIIRAMMMPPWKPTSSMFRPKRLMVSGTTRPLAAS